MLYLELFIQGLVQGSIYALIALGLTLVYGLLRILHVAHAALFTLGGYIGVIVSNATGSFTLAMIVAMLLVGFAGMLMYKLMNLFYRNHRMFHSLRRLRCSSPQKKYLGLLLVLTDYPIKLCLYRGISNCFLDSI